MNKIQSFVTKCLFCFFLLRIKRLRREQSVKDKFVQSERQFEKELNILIAKRQEIEEKFRKIMDMSQTPKSRIYGLNERHSEPTKVISNSSIETSDFLLLNFHIRV